MSQNTRLAEGLGKPANGASRRRLPGDMANRFCTNCGTALLAEARFCVACGHPVSGGARRRLGLRWPSARVAPVAVVLVVLLVGTAAVVGGRASPRPQPRLPGRGSGAAAAAPGAPGGEQELPSGHPPVQIPDDVREAIRGLADRAAKAPEDMALWKQLAEVQYRAGLIDPAYLPEATAAFQHVLQREPDNLDAVRGLGNIAFDQDQPDVAIGYYQRVLQARPDDRDLRTDLATMYLAAGRTQEAIDAYEAVLRAHPGFFQATYNLALAYQAAGQPERALATLEQAQTIAPDDRTRQQVAQILARVKGEPPPTAAAAAAPTASGPLTFQTDTERLFRENSVLAPKLQRIEWTTPVTVRVLVADFPMDQMGDAMRAMFVERMQGRLREKKAAHGVTEPARIEFVDAPSGRVLAAVDG